MALFNVSTSPLLTGSALKSLKIGPLFPANRDREANTAVKRPGVYSSVVNYSWRYRAVRHLFLTFVEIVKRSNSCIFSSATSDLFCSAKYEIFYSLVEIRVILKFL